jgi:transcriptional regulator with XRE-family HTH domain
MHLVTLERNSINGRMPTLGEKLRKGMKSRRLSQAEVAKALGTNQSQVSAWVNGVVPSVNFLFRLSKILDLSIDYLLDDDVERPRRRLEGVVLTPDEEKLLWAAHKIGIDIAIDRLLNVEPTKSAAKPPPGQPQDPGRVLNTDERAPYIRPHRNGKTSKDKGAG